MPPTPQNRPKGTKGRTVKSVKGPKKPRYGPHPSVRRPKR